MIIKMNPLILFTVFLVAALNLSAAPGRPPAPVRDPHTPGFVAAMDTRALGMAVCALGGGRRQASDQLDYRVGLSGLVELGAELMPDTPLLFIHAADTASADEAERRVRQAMRIAPQAPAALPLVYQTIRQPEQEPSQ
jgi:thymidine phosphorylase